MIPRTLKATTSTSCTNTSYRHPSPSPNTSHHMPEICCAGYLFPTHEEEQTCSKWPDTAGLASTAMSLASLAAARRAIVISRLPHCRRVKKRYLEEVLRSVMRRADLLHPQEDICRSSRLAARMARMPETSNSVMRRGGLYSSSMSRPRTQLREERQVRPDLHQCRLCRLVLDERGRGETRKDLLRFRRLRSETWRLKCRGRTFRAVRWPCHLRVDLDETPEPRPTRLRRSALKVQHQCPDQRLATPLAQRGFHHEATRTANPQSRHPRIRTHRVTSPNRPARAT